MENSWTVRLWDVLLDFVFKFLKGEVFDASIKVIPNVYSYKANAEFTIVCFDGIDVIGWFRSKRGIVRMRVQMQLFERFSKDLVLVKFSPQPLSESSRNASPPLRAA